MDDNPNTTAHFTRESAVIAPALWNPTVAGMWSVLLTPIFGSVVILKNWQSIGEQPRVKTGWAWLAVSVAMIIVFGATYWIHLIYLLAWYLAWPMKQARYVNERWGANYPKKSWVAPLLVGLGVIVALAVALVGWLVVLQV